MPKFVRETAAGSSIAAWIVTNGRGEFVAKVQAHFASSVRVDVFDSERDVQHGRAGGYGYDKLTAALSGLVIGGHTLADHCEVSLKPPRGLPGFPKDYKRRGYQTANYAHWIRDNAESAWRPLSDVERRAFLFGRDESPDDTAARDRVKAADARGDLFRGFTSCHKVAGLDYLKARGLRVFQAI